MKQGKFAAPVRRRRRRNTLKPMLIAMAVVLLLGCVTGGTLAWLTATTPEVKNTFTVGNIDIDLAETWNHDSDGNGTKDSWQGKMIPGYTIEKDPKVTVFKGSEKCYLFVKVTENIGITTYSFDKYISYAIDTGDTGWTVLDAVNHPGVYYRVVESSSTDQNFKVLVGDKVTVNPTVTKAMMDALGSDTANYPTLTFQAAAVQYYKNSDAENNYFDVTDAYDMVKESLT